MLRPAAFNAVISVPANELKNENIDATLIFGAGIKEVEERVKSAIDKKSRVKIIENFLESLIIRKNRFDDGRITEAVNILSARGGIVNMSSLSQHANLSHRHFERRFQAEIGITAKEFARVLRFQRAIHMKQLNNNLTLTNLAYVCGYHDQSHFTNDFKSISGLTPKQFFKIIPAFSDYYSFL